MGAHLNRALCAALVAILLLSGCGGQPGDAQQPVIRLSVLEPLPGPATENIIPLRVSVGAVISPRGTVESYQPLLDYLSGRLERPVELVQRRTYSETNALVAGGEADVAFVCTSAYIAGREEFGMRLLVAPRVNGATTYNSLLIVPAASTARSIADLHGKVFAFTDPMSNTGRVYPTGLVRELGATSEQFFARTFFTYSHDAALNAVATGLADGAAVDSLVYYYALERDPALASKVRVIHTSSPFGIPPVVVGPDSPPQLQAILKEILLNMDEYADGRVALRQLGVDAFVEIEDSAYDSVRELVTQVGPLTP
jgi:phosphonate transport system substrate-binding protein